MRPQAMFYRKFPIALLAGLTLAGSAAKAADPAREHYDAVVRHAQSGVYVFDGNLFVQVRSPYDEESDTRTKKRLMSIPVASALLKQWCIDHAGGKNTAANPVAKGMFLVRQMVLRHNPDWEYKDWKMAAPAREFVSVDGGFHSLCLVFSENDIVANIPESFSRSIPDEEWCKALGEIVEPMMGKGPSSFAFFDEVGYAEYRDESSPYTKPFSQWNASDAASLLQDDLRKTMVVRAGSRGESERRQLLESTAKYIAESPNALGFLEDGRALATPSVTTGHTEKVFSTHVVTNVAVLVSTNIIACAAGKTDFATLPQSKSSFSERHLSWKGQIDVALQTTPRYTITTQETTTIIQTTSLSCDEIVATATATPRFEAIFLGCGYAGNRVSARTPLGQSAIDFFLRKGKTAEKKRQLIIALRENPGDKELWNGFGRILQIEGDWIGSTICFRNALSLDSRYEFALANLAESFASLGYRDLAIGTALVGRAFAADPWCVSNTEKILKKSDWE